MLAIAILAGVAAVAGGVAAVLSRWPVGEEVNAVCELIEHDRDDWADVGTDKFVNKKAGLSVRVWHNYSNELRMELKGEISRSWQSMTWAERRKLTAAMRRWETKRIQEVVIKALED